MSELLAFQDAFVAALGGDVDALSAWRAKDSSPVGLAVYRNTIAKGCVDALAENFPTVRALTSEEWFSGAALLFSRESPPSHAALQDYGADFPSWLASFPPAAELPYLAGVAHLDRLWLETLFAAEAPHLEATVLSELSPEALASARLRPHPSLRFVAFDAGLPGLWLAARARDEALELSEAPQAVMLVRRSGVVATRLMQDGEAEFLRAVRDGETLGLAAERAAKTQPDAPLETLFAALIADGVFSALDPEPHS